MKILVILPRFPYPLEKGDKLRAYHQVRVLSQQNDVYLFVISHEAVSASQRKEMEQYCKDICIVRLSKFEAAVRAGASLLVGQSLQVGYWYTSRALRAYKTFEAKVSPDVVYAQMVRTLRYAATARCPKVLDYQDALSMNADRRAQKSTGPMRWLMEYERDKLVQIEMHALQRMDALTIISAPDRNSILSQSRRQGVKGEIQLLENGVDLDFFAPQEIQKQHDIVFCGNMQYAPNVDAAQYLVQDIMPRVWAQNPNVKVVLAGATPTAKVQRLAEDKRVVVTGSVPDIRPYYAQSRLFVAPMRIGSGLQNKLLEAMSMGVPCVTTTLANDALGARHGQQLLIGDNATELADNILHLLDDAELCQRLVSDASRFVSDRYSWQAAGQRLENILKHVGQNYNK
ncbi:MAG: glycosyltransferase [Bacteroidales bacterium]|nr:glycosyltransferase [Bacteroidales bacterium]